ncbi:MAG: O-antigen ligase family protein [Candidatus Coproplasma sp.]
MGFSEAIKKINLAKIKEVCEKAFSSYIFPFVTAAVTVICTTFGLEPLIIWYICLCGAAISLFCKDVSPAICMFVFMHILVSMQHSPDPRVQLDWFDPAFMTSIAFIIQASVAVALFAGSCIYRIVDSIIKHRFKITPIFIGLCVYVAALLLCGFFSDKYYYMDTVLALGIGAVILVMFVYTSGNVVINEKTYKRIAVIFVALCIALAIQLLVTYIMLDVVVDGEINRTKIQFGWGTYNQFGMLITMCIPAWFYLAAKCKNGFLYLIGVPFNLFVSLMCMSRQAILMSAVLIVCCLIWYLITVPKKQKLYGGAVTLGFVVLGLIACLILYLCKREVVTAFFGDLSTQFITGSGRTDIWQEGLKQFLHNPVFGNGFYDLTAAAWKPGYCGEGYGATDVIPFMCHNTFVQLLYCGGIVGLAAYLFHRVQTVISLFKNPDSGRLFIAFTECGILLTSLLDNHIFYFLPLFIYTPLLAVFAVSEKKEQAIGVQEIDTGIEQNAEIRSANNA